MSNANATSLTVDAALTLAGELGFEVAIASTWEGRQIWWDAYIILPDSWGDAIAEVEDSEAARAILRALELALEAQGRSKQLAA